MGVVYVNGVTPGGGICYYDEINYNEEGGGRDVIQPRLWMKRCHRDVEKRMTEAKIQVDGNFGI